MPTVRAGLAGETKGRKKGEEEEKKEEDFHL